MRPFPLACLGVALSLCPHALAERTAGNAPRDGAEGILLAGLGLGPLASNLSIDGRRTPPTGGAAFELEAGYLQGLGRAPIAVGAAARGGTFIDEWAEAVGEGRYRLDLRFVSEARWVFAPRRYEQPCVTASVGVGPTVAWIVPPVRQVVVERYDTAVGLHAALRIGMRVRVRGHHVLYYATEGSFHRVSTYRTASVRGGSPRASRERYLFQDRSFGLVAGYALSL